MEELNKKIMQQEAKYDFLKEEVHCLNAEKIELQIRIDKAIEYISEYRNGWNNWFEFTIDDKLKLLDILKGDNKNG